MRGAVLVHRQVSRCGGKAEVQAAEGKKFGPLNWIPEMFGVTRNLDCQFVVLIGRLSLPDRGIFPHGIVIIYASHRANAAGAFPLTGILLAHSNATYR